MGCPLVILGCNTASAKALRSIQQIDLPKIDPTRRVLGVIRPTAEIIGKISKTRHVGIFATPGTIRSRTYELEIAKLFPDIKVTGIACPMWVSLVENREFASPGADYFVKKRIDDMLAADTDIDAVILGCTHYPLLMDKIKQYMPAHVSVIPQGEIVAESLADYMHRHPEMEQRCRRGGTCHYLTTEDADKFDSLAGIFVNEPVHAEKITLH